MAAGEQYKLNVESKTVEPAYDEAYLSKVDYDLWTRPGAEAAVQPEPLPLQLALALGLRQRRHRQPGAAPVRHRALGPRQERASRAHRLEWRLLRPALVAGDARHPHVARSSTPTGRSSSSPRAVRTPTTKARRRSAICSTEPKGGSGSTATARSGSPITAPRTTRARASDLYCRGERRWQRSERADEHRVPALPELRGCAARERSEDPDVRYPRRASVVYAAASCEYRLPHQALP